MKKLFTNDKFFKSVCILGSVGLLLGTTIGLIRAPEFWMNRICGIIIGLCLVFLYSSYAKHSKNVMKGLMGALLMARLILSIMLFDEILIPADLVFTPIIAVLSALLFVNHFIINSDRHSNPTMVRMNQLLCALLGIAYFAWDIIWAFSFRDALIIAASFAFALGYVSLYAAVVCVESRLDAHRLDREAAGWTEEKGYPEGYVHEYEKK